MSLSEKTMVTRIGSVQRASDSIPDYILMCIQILPKQFQKVQACQIFHPANQFSYIKSLTLARTGMEVINRDGRWRCPVPSTWCYEYGAHPFPIRSSSHCEKRMVERLAHSHEPNQEGRRCRCYQRHGISRSWAASSSRPAHLVPAVPAPRCGPSVTAPRSRSTPLRRRS